MRMLLAGRGQDGCDCQFPGVLYRHSAAEGGNSPLPVKNFVHAVIQLPPDLFARTDRDLHHIVLKKRARYSVLFVDTPPNVYVEKQEP